MGAFMPELNNTYTELTSNINRKEISTMNELELTKPELTKSELTKSELNGKLEHRLSLF